MKKICLLFLLSALLLAEAGAHALWLEPDKSGALRLCFGEYEKQLREPVEKFERLGKILIEAQTAEGTKPLQLQKGKESFLIPKPQPGTDILFRTENLPVREPKTPEQPPARSLWYGRFIADRSKPLSAILPLDIVFTDGMNPAAVQVIFKGKALPGAILKIVGSDGKQGEVKADDQGRAVLDVSAPGLCQVTVSFGEKAPGEFEGKKYELLNHRCTLTFVSK